MLFGQRNRRRELGVRAKVTVFAVLLSVTATMSSCNQSRASCSAAISEIEALLKASAAVCPRWRAGNSVGTGSPSTICCKRIIRRRVARGCEETPVHFIVFDLLVDDAGKALFDLPLATRRPKLESFAKKHLAKNKTIELSPKTKDLTVPREWLSTTGLKLDGVIAKRLDLPYRSGERDGMQQVKRMRTADCVVGGLPLRVKRKGRRVVAVGPVRR